MHTTSNTAEERTVYKLQFVSCYKQGQRLQQLILSTDVLTLLTSNGTSIILGCLLQSNKWSIWLCGTPSEG